MLVLSRRNQEAILIGDDIRITILRTQGDTVRLGIEAPPHVPVHRQELRQRILGDVSAEPQCAAKETSRASRSSSGSRKRSVSPSSNHDAA